MKIYVCPICGYEFDSISGDEENGILPRTDFEDLSDEWLCPLCGAPKEDFEGFDRYDE